MYHRYSPTHIENLRGCRYLKTPVWFVLLLRKIYNLQEELEVTKGVIQIRNSKKDICSKTIQPRSNQWQKKMDKRTNNDLQNIAYKTKDWVTQVSSISFYILILWLYKEIEITRRKFYGRNQDLI